MDFLEEEAEVEEESSLSSEGEKVVESGEDDSDAVEGRKKKKIQEEMKDFIKDDVEEEAEEESGDEGGKRKHEDSDIDDRLEDEDYDLIEENLGIKVKRKPKHKRIRVLSEDEDSDRGEEEGDKGREAVAEQLGFDSDVGEGEEPSQPAETDYQNLVESEEEEDGM
ncbi:SPT6 [Mytilus edulis]|uniref:SUPT6H n=1 Tax=Mytilus edulis TaxID=6550 RepID=A0A8S3S096_MYTED|nr:SPT6 [Mytilus edulis]